MNINHFLSVYERLVKQEASSEEIDSLHMDLIPRVQNTHIAKAVCDVSSQLEKAIAIDNCAHQMHIDENFAKKLYPLANYADIKKKLDEFSGMEAINEVRKVNRNFFTPILSDPEFTIISKMVGITKASDIGDAIQEYKALYDAEQKAGGAELVSDAELLTLYRYTKDKKYQNYWKKRGREQEPLVVAGYASVEMVDKENHLITTEALEDAFGRFVKSFRTRNNQLSHSSIQCGWLLRSYINKDGETFKSGVDEKGLFMISEVRPDIEIAKRMRKEIEKGTIKSYSIAGTATKKEYKNMQGRQVMVVNGLDLCEATYCESPVNQKSNFFIIKSEDDPIAPKRSPVITGEDTQVNTEIHFDEKPYSDEKELESYQLEQIQHVLDNPMRISDYTVSLVRTGDYPSIIIRASKNSFLGKAIKTRITQKLLLENPKLLKKAKFIYDPFGPKENFIPLFSLSLEPIDAGAIELSEDDKKGLKKDPTIKQQVALRSFKGHKILREHDDGDLTIKNDDGVYIITVEGDIFRQQMPDLKIISSKNNLNLATTKNIQEGEQTQTALERFKSMIKEY